MDFEKFFLDYQFKLIQQVFKIDWRNLEKAAKLLLIAHEEKKTVFIIGNGGSAATAMHLASDLAKTVRGHDGDSRWFGFRTISLSDNTSLLTAWANDAGYEKSFSGQLENWGGKGDVLIAISSSGNSKNIVSCAQLAKKLGLKVIGISGFGGGELAKVVDTPLVSNLNEYGPVEDIQLILGHMLTNYLYDLFQKKHAKK